MTWRDLKNFINKRARENKQFLDIEVNLFEFNDDIYDKNLTVHVLHYLRAEEKFDGLPALVAQMHMDKQRTLQVLPSQLNG